MPNSNNQDKGINKFLKVEYLRAISDYPIEIIALLSLLGAFYSGYMFFNSDLQKQYLLYSLLLFLVAVLVLMFIYWEKQKKKTNDSVSIPINYYPTMSEVKKAIDNIFETMAETSEITQTYIRNNFLAGSQDVIFKNAFVKMRDKENKPTLNRIFVLFDPLDINFAEHSYETSHGSPTRKNRIYGEVYGENLNNIYIASSSGDKLANIIPNMTMIDGKVLVSFPTRTSDYTKFPKKLVENPSGSSTKGVEIENSDFYSEYKQYLTKTQGEGLSRIKNQFFEQDNIAYYYSILFSIAKELIHDKGLKDKILFLGIVGSLANCVESYNKFVNPGDINDLDLQIIFRDLTSDCFQISKEISTLVCKRFSIENVLDFDIETDSSPIKIAKYSSGVPQIPIHLLLSDKKSCKKLDKFIAVDRIQHAGNITFEWFLLENGSDSQTMELKELLKESLDDGLITYKDLTSPNYFYSLSSCLRVLESNKPCLRIKKWTQEKGNDYILEEFEKELPPIEIANFVKYSLKWGIINFFNCVENYNVNKNSYSRDFHHVLPLIKQIIPNFNDASLINIYKKKDNEISREDILIVVNCLKRIETFIESKIT